MQATAISDFSATVHGRDFKCSQGETVEADKATIAQLEAIGLVTTKQQEKRTGARKPGKAGRNDD